jgi:plasmid maintenance system antidote protein VapI
VEGPAAVLRGARLRESLTQVQLAKKLAIHQHHLSEMENGKRPIGKEMAKKLGEALNANWRVFI